MKHGISVDIGTTNITTQLTSLNDRGTSLIDKLVLVKSFSASNSRG